MISHDTEKEEVRQEVERLRVDEALGAWWNGCLFYADKLGNMG